MADCFLSLVQIALLIFGAHALGDDPIFVTRRYVVAGCARRVIGIVAVLPLSLSNGMLLVLMSQGGYLSWSSTFRTVLLLVAAGMTLAAILIIAFLCRKYAHSLVPELSSSFADGKD